MLHAGQCIAASYLIRSTLWLCRGSNGDRSKCCPAPRPTKEGYTVEALKEAGSILLRKCHDIYPCARLALQASLTTPDLLMWCLLLSTSALTART